MSKIAVVYWSGTGNTEAMANAVADGVNENGGNATLYTADSFNGDMVNDFDAIAFGCPAMGAEVLEDEEFEPMFNGCESSLMVRKSLYSVHMVGAMVNGCVTGKRLVLLTVQFLQQKV